MAASKKELVDNINKQVNQLLQELNELNPESEVKIQLEDDSDPRIVKTKSGKINFSIEEEE